MRSNREWALFAALCLAILLAVQSVRWRAEADYALQMAELLAVPPKPAVSVEIDNIGILQGAICVGPAWKREDCPSGWAWQGDDPFMKKQLKDPRWMPSCCQQASAPPTEKK